MECVRNSQLKANGERKKIKNEVQHPISLYVERMIKTRKRLSEQKGIRKKRKISKKTVTNYWQTAKKQVLPYFGDKDAVTITKEEIEDYLESLDYSPKYIKDIKMILKLSNA